MLSPQSRAKAEEIVGRYPMSRSALLPLLHLVQHQDGRLTDDGIAECAELLELTKAEVNAVATFYTMYKRDQLGEHLVSVCTNFSCAVRGANEVYARLHDKLGVGQNETTEDGKFTLEHAECLGNCEGAPVVTVDYLNYECLDADGAEELVDRIAAGEIPPPTRGFPPPGIREVQHRLAGLGPLPSGADPSRVGDGLGRASSQARAADGAVPPVTVGPDAGVVTVQSSFTPVTPTTMDTEVGESGSDAPEAVDDPRREEQAPDVGQANEDTVAEERAADAEADETERGEG